MDSSVCLFQVGSTSQDEELTETESVSQGDTQSTGLEKIKELATELLNSWSALKVGLYIVLLLYYCIFFELSLKH